MSGGPQLEATNNSNPGGLNVDSGDMHERGRDQSQYGRDIISQVNPQAGIQGQNIAVANPDPATSVKGRADVSINEMAAQAGEAAYNNVMQYAKQHGIEEGPAREVAVQAREHARHIATGTEGERERSQDPNSPDNELEEIEKKLKEAEEMLQAELEQLREQQGEGLSEDIPEGVSVSERISEADRNRLEIEAREAILAELSEQLEGVQETLALQRSIVAGTEEERQAGIDGLQEMAIAEYADQVKDTVQDFFQAADLEQLRELFQEQMDQQGQEIDAVVSAGAILDGFVEFADNFEEQIAEAQEREEARQEAAEERLERLASSIASQFPPEYADEFQGVDSMAELGTLVAELNTEVNATEVTATVVSTFDSLLSITDELNQNTLAA